MRDRSRAFLIPPEPHQATSATRRTTVTLRRTMRAELGVFLQHLGGSTSGYLGTAKNPADRRERGAPQVHGGRFREAS